MNELNNTKGTNDYVPILFDNYENLKLQVTSLVEKAKGSDALIEILHKQNEEYTEKIIELRRICGFSHKYTDSVEGYLKVDKKYTLLHESNVPIVTLLRVKETTCIVQFSHGELKEVCIDFLQGHISEDYKGGDTINYRSTDGDDRVIIIHSDK